jgi:hypothetical protein
MSVSKQKDGWDRNASQLLRRRISEGSPDRSISYAPDVKYGAPPGPLTVQIDELLRRHADLWAHTMRTAQQSDQASAVFGRSTWLEQMRQADAEIKRLIAGHKVGHGAAA